MVRCLVRTLTALALTLTVLPQIVLGGAAMSLTDHVWQWQETHLQDGTVVSVNDPSRYRVEFMTDGSLSIKADCNIVLGTYQTTDDQLTLTPGPSTLVGCPPDSQADVFMQQLTNVSEYLFAGEMLILNLKSDSGGMHFAPVVNTPLVGTDWMGQAFLFGSGFTTPLSGTQLTIQFGADGRVSGSSGCNRFMGSYQTSGESLTIGPLATTRMACAADIMNQEQAFLKALETTSTYRIVGTVLTLSDASGTRTAEFVAP